MMQQLLGYKMPNENHSRLASFFKTAVALYENIVCGIEWKDSDERSNSTAIQIWIA